MATPEPPVPYGAGQRRAAGVASSADGAHGHTRAGDSQERFWGQVTAGNLVDPPGLARAPPGQRPQT